MKVIGLYETYRNNNYTNEQYFHIRLLLYVYCYSNKNS